jgi:tetratricopeptide (TPR) repeat protein
MGKIDCLRKASVKNQANHTYKGVKPIVLIFVLALHSIIGKACETFSETAAAVTHSNEKRSRLASDTQSVIGSDAPGSDTLLIDQWNRQARRLLNTVPDSAFIQAQKAVQRAATLRYSRGLAQGYETMGWVFYNQGVFTQSIGYFLQSIEFYKAIGDTRGVAETYNHLGVAYYYGLDANTAMKAHRQALMLYEQVADPKGKAETYGYLGHLYEKQKDYPKALHYQHQALHLYQTLGEQAGVGQILENLGSVYEDLARYPQAADFFQQALAINRRINRPLGVINNLNNIGDTFRKQGNYSQALAYTRQACRLARQLNQRAMLCSAWKDLSKTYALMKQMTLAHTYLDSSYALYEKIYDEESARQIARMQTVYQTEQSQKELALKTVQVDLLEKDKRISRLQLTATCALIVLLVASGFWVVRYQRLKIRQNQKIMQQTKQLYEAQLTNAHLNEEKLSAELENHLLKKQQLEQQLTVQAQQLTSHTLLIVQKNRFLEELKGRLHQIRKSDRDKSHLLKQLIGSIDYSFKLDKDWDEFRTVFEKVHKDFFSNLKDKYPGLNANDLRLCALIKLNISSHDMAALLGISQDSLRIARYRLRKKLLLEERANLTDFVMQF